MGCIEINYKKYHIKITNGETESDVWTHSDSELLYQFITYGILPEGYTLESNLNIQSKNDIIKVFQTMIEEIEENTSNTPLLRQILMSPELINKMAGNRDWGVNMYDRYEQDNRTRLQHNCYYISGWGSKSWYGFTSKRPFKITGWASSEPNIIDDTLLKSYYSLLDGNKFVRKTIEKLYKKYNSEGLAEDVYAKMTWLANNKLKDLTSALYIPRNIWTRADAAKIDNPEQIKGLGVKYKDQMYILTGKGNNDEFEAMKVSLTEDTIIKIKKTDIFGLYQSFTVTDNSGEYIIVNKIWYKLEKGNYVRVDDPTISNGLFDKWFGLVDDYEFETIDTSNKELNVTLEHQTENGTLSEVLPIGSYVRTATGYFTKGFDGIFRNGDKILSSNEKIYKIFFKNIKDDQSYEEKVEIAKRVYNAQIIWGHPGIGKTHFFNTGIQEVIDFDSVYKPRINKELNIPEGEIERKKWRKNNKEKYKNKILELFDEAVLESKRTGKKLLVSDMIVLEKREDVLDIITQMSEENFAHRSEQRDEPYDENRKLWKQDIDEVMNNVQDKSKVVFSNDYFSDIYFLGKSLSEQDNEDELISFLSSDSVEIQGKLGFNKQQIINLLGSKMYKENAQEVAIKELVQNAFDAVKIAKTNGAISEAEINVVINADDRTIIVSDNGIGMTPEIVQKAFFTIGGSYKGEGIDNSLKSGGLGLAKMAFLFSSEYVDVITVKDGIQTHVHTTPAEISSDNFKLVTSKTNSKNGTSITVKIPETFTDENGNIKNIYFSRTSSFLSRPLIGDVKLNITNIYNRTEKTETLDKSIIPNGYLYLGDAKSNFGKLQIYAKPTSYPTSTITYQVLNSGLFQFMDHIYLDGKSNIELIINILPSVDTMSTIYPINNQREGFNVSVKPEIDDLKFFIKSLNNSINIQKLQKAFNNTISMDIKKIDVARAKNDSNFETTLKTAVEQTAKTLGISKPISSDNSINLSDITQSRVQSEKNRTSSFDSSGINVGSKIETVDTSHLDIIKPVFHNNTTMTIDEDGRKVLESIGQMLMELKELYIQTYEGQEIKTRHNQNITEFLKTQYWGISFDKNYGGVNVHPKLFNFLGINPFYSIPNMNNINPALAMTEYITHLIIHEFNHNYASGEGASFTGRFPMTYAEFAGIGIQFNKDFKNKLYNLIKDNWEVFVKYNNAYGAATNVSDSFEGAHLERTSDVKDGSMQTNGQTTSRNSIWEDVFGFGEDNRTDNDKSIEIKENTIPISSKTPIEIVKASIPYEEDSYILSKQDAIIILSEYGIEDFSNVWFKYDSDNVAEILQTGSGESRKTILKINLKNIEQNSDNIRKLKLAVNFFKMMSKLQPLPPQLISNAHEIFEYLVVGDFSIDEIEVKKGENFTLDPNLKPILKNHFSKVEYKNDEWISILSENKNALLIWNDNIEAEIDQKIKQAEKDNNIIRMCSLQ